MQKKAMDKELAALGAVMECIKFCNLESEFPSDKISKRIGILENEGQLLGREVGQSTKKKQRKNSFGPKDETQQSQARGPRTTTSDKAVSANKSLGSALPQSPSPNVRTELPEGFVELNSGLAPEHRTHPHTNMENTVDANTSSGSALQQSHSPNVRTPECFVKLNFGFAPKDQTQQSKTNRPQTTELNNAVGARMSSSSASPQPPSTNGWTKPPEGFVKLNFGFVGRSDCGFLSVVACDNNGAVLAIWCRKIPQSDPLIGEAFAALGALTQASSKGWDAIFLEGDSLQLISNLQRCSEPVLSISSIVSNSLLCNLSGVPFQFGYRPRPTLWPVMCLSGQLETMFRMASLGYQCLITCFLFFTNCNVYIIVFFLVGLLVY